MLTNTGEIIAKAIELLITDYYTKCYPEDSEKYTCEKAQNCSDKKCKDKEFIEDSKNSDLNNTVYLLENSKNFNKSLEDIQTIFRSGHLIKILLCFQENKVDRYELKNNIGIKNSNTATFTNKIRWLTEKKILIERRNTLLVNKKFEDNIIKIQNIIKSTVLIINHGDYLNNHTIKELPEFAQNNMCGLYNSEYICNSPKDPYKYNNLNKSIILEAEEINSISNHIAGEYLDPLINKAQSDIKINAIITKYSISHIYGEPAIRDLIEQNKFDNVKLMVTDHPIFFIMTVTDKTLIIRFSSTTDGAFDTSRGLISTSEEAINWGMELYEHYQKDAIPICDYINHKNSGI
ncbi:helix-turn-helix transcriptional regulator [Methanoplanus endosymbiosus]|uniref:DUF1724 domain-containing protein n=1 Tax=Methanoplanus endosymbiosus TaxID=33865 RepID=A0A9E7PLW5_9EURY|nr:transcriptional regulator FilR1 domain-containing protein [Methanoplanus endosymbiosus]UUX92553.1 DUF1724 domain-containing protein [Methanoplanus endosymbiosus]